MLSALKEIFLFFRKERLYFLLLILVLSFSALVLSSSQNKKHTSEETEIRVSEEYQSFVDAEKKFDEKMAREDSYLEFVQGKPVLAVIFQSVTLFFLLAILAGVIFDALLLLKPGWRQKFIRNMPLQAKPWPFSILFKVVLLYIVWGFLISVVMGAVHAMFPKFASGNFYMIVHTSLVNALAIFFIFRFLKREGSDWRELGLRVPEGGVAREAGVGLLGYLGVLPLFVLSLMVLLLIAHLMAYEPPPHPLVNVFLEEEKRQPMLFMFSVFLGMVIGPIFEEIFFRGFCYPVLKGKVGKFWAVVVTSAVFAGIHNSGFAFWPIFILGVALTCLYEARKTLVSPIVMHIFHNTVFISYFFLVKKMIT